MYVPHDSLTYYARQLRAESLLSPIEPPPTVLSIAGMGVQKQNASYYNVKLSISTSLELLPGMNATVYLP